VQQRIVDGQDVVVAVDGPTLLIFDDMRRQVGFVNCCKTVVSVALRLVLRRRGGPV
jgi:hypothetical protein